MKSLTLFLLIFVPIFLIIYGTVSKVVLSGREQAGQEALRPNQISNEGSRQTIKKR